MLRNGSVRLAASWITLFVLGAALAPGARAQVAEDAPPRPVMVAPRLVESPPIELAADAAPLPPDASVELSITVAADGSVAEVAIATPLRDDVDALALEAARAMRFEPATRDGTPIPARIRFRYRIETPAPPAPPDAAPVDPPIEGPDSEPEPEPSEAPAPEADAPIFSARALADPPEPGAASRITLTGAELTTVPGTFGEPLRVVATLPGVVRSPFGIGYFLVRGANFQNTGYFIDGFPVPLLYHLGFGPAVVNSRMVQRLRFYPGGYPVSYGRYSAGVIAIETGVPRDQPLHLEVEVDVLRAAAMAVIPWDDGRGSVTLAIRRSYYELIIPLIVPGLYLHYMDYQARIAYRWRDLEASVFFFGSDDVVDQSGAIGGGLTSEGSNTRIGLEFQRVIARLQWQLPDDGRVTLSGTIGRDAQSFGSSQVGQARQRIGTEALQLGLRLDFQLNLLPWLRTNFGLDMAGTVFSVAVTAPAPTGLGEYPRPVFDPQLIELSARVGRGTPGLYAEAIFDVAPVEVSLGVRADLLRYGTVTEVAPDPRLVTRWTIVPEVTVKAATGLFTQPPIAFQLVSTGGNPGLGPQRSWQTSAGVELRFPYEIEAELTGYYSHMFDLARFSQNIVTGPDGRPRREFFRADQEGRAYGLEVLLRRRVADGFYGWLSYTLSRSERVSPSSGGWVPFGFDQTHTLNIAASYEIDGWRVGATFQLASGRPTRQIIGAEFDADANEYDPVTGEAFDRLPTYHQLNLRVDRDFDLGGIIRGSVYLDVINVYYAQNAEGVIYQYDYARSAPLPGIPILGTLGIRAYYE